MEVKCIDNSKYPEFLITGKIYNVVGNFSLNRERHYWIDNYEGSETKGKQCGVEAKFFEPVRKIKIPVEKIIEEVTTN